MLFYSSLWTGLCYPLLLTVFGVISLIYPDDRVTESNDLVLWTCLSIFINVSLFQIGLAIGAFYVAHKRRKTSSFRNIDIFNTRSKRIVIVVIETLLGVVIVLSSLQQQVCPGLDDCTSNFSV